MLRSRTKFFLLTLSLILLSILLQVVASPIPDSIAKKKPTPIYQRYVRKRPPVYADDEYMEEIVEIFHVRKKPPKYAMSDEEIDLIIRCDFNPEYKDCDKLKNKEQPPGFEQTNTFKPPLERFGPTEELPFLSDLPPSNEDETTIPIETTKDDQYNTVPQTKSNIDDYDDNGDFEVNEDYDENDDEE